MVDKVEHVLQMTLFTPPDGKEMRKVFQKSAGMLGVRLKVVKGEGPDVCEVVKNLSPDTCDVILTRRIFTSYIRALTTIPVVSVELCTMDLLRLLQPYVGKIGNVLIFRPGEALSGIKYVSHALGMNIRQFTYRRYEEMAAYVRALTGVEAELLIGGVLLRNLATPLGIPVIDIAQEEEIASRSLNDAVEIASAWLYERQQAVRMDTILDSIGEGILVVDETGLIRTANLAAETLLNWKKRPLAGHNLRQVAPALWVPGGLKSAENGKVQDVRGKTLIINRTPILFQGSSMGMVCSLTDARCIQQAADNLRIRRTTDGFRAKYTFEQIRTCSPLMRRQLEYAKLYASTEASLLLRGESGTGKELFAQSIHNASPRRAGPFVAVNCAAIPEGLLESELFGYEEGAFTGARRQGKCGLFELADHGTLLLDEVGDLPLPLQGQLLRVLQEREMLRVGGTRVIPLDIRVICATHQNLEHQVECGTMRADLYYRLNVLTLHIPPLRARPEDILGIGIPHLLGLLCVPPDEKLLEEQLGPLLNRHAWLGNVRELFSVMERLALIANHSPKVRHWGELLSAIWEPDSDESCAVPFSAGEKETDAAPAPSLSLKQSLREMEQAILEQHLEKCGGKLGDAARALGVSRMTLWRKRVAGRAGTRGKP